MTHTIPTAATFKARHPRFAAVADATADIYMAEAARTVTTMWAEADYGDGIMYLAAHLMLEEGALAPTGAAPGVSGQTKRVKAGEVEKEYAIRDLPADTGLGLYGSTIYGRRYLEVAARNGGNSAAAVLVV